MMMKVIGWFAIPAVVVGVALVMSGNGALLESISAQEASELQGGNIDPDCGYAYYKVPCGSAWGDGEGPGGEPCPAGTCWTWRFPVVPGTYETAQGVAVGKKFHCSGTSEFCGERFNLKKCTKPKRR